MSAYEHVVVSKILRLRIHFPKMGKNPGLGESPGGSSDVAVKYSLIYIEIEWLARLVHVCFPSALDTFWWLTRERKCLPYLSPQSKWKVEQVTKVSHHALKRDMTLILNPILLPSNFMNIKMSYLLKGICYTKGSRRNHLRYDRKNLGIRIMRISCLLPLRLLRNFKNT